MTDQPAITSNHATGPTAQWLPDNPAEWIILGLITGLLFVLFHFQGMTVEVQAYGHSMFRWVVQKWSEPGGTMSHGWLVPLTSGLLVWRRRKELATAPKRVSWVGLLLVVLALLLHWVGLRVQQSRLNVFAFIGLLWSIPLYLYGRRTGWLILFPCAFLLFCVPWNFLDGITFPLRLLATRVASAMAYGLGIEVTRIGTAIHSVPPGLFSFQVADPCSGLRYLVALSALTALYAHWTQKGWARQWLLFLCAVPIAMAANIVRIVSLVIVANWFGEETAMKTYHDYSGLIVFVAATLIMVGIGTLLQWNIKETLHKWKSSDTSTRLS